MGHVRKSKKVYAFSFNADKARVNNGARVLLESGYENGKFLYTLVDKLILKDELEGGSNIIKLDRPLEIYGKYRTVVKYY